MSFIDDIVIPGDKGRTFMTSVSDPEELSKLKNAVLKVNGVTDVSINTEVFPTEVHVIADVVVDVESIENEVNGLGFHLLPKSNL
ncbi:heavy-metal-associated domain-containing protein [Neptunitalea lumnitzerae]|nr:heavy-metal-associated domain-containing protein [Neptunitalea sp. Y10]